MERQNVPAVVGAEPGQADQAFDAGFLHRGDDDFGSLRPQTLLVQERHAERAYDHVVALNRAPDGDRVQHIALDHPHVFVGPFEFPRGPGKRRDIVTLRQRLIHQIAPDLSGCTKDNYFHCLFLSLDTVSIDMMSNRCTLTLCQVKIPIPGREF